MFKVVYIGILLFLCIALSACVESDVKRGNNALMIGDLERAIINFSKALDQEPAHRDARYGLALAYFSKAEERERLHQESYDLWNLTAREFKVLSKLDSSEQIKANYSTCLFYLARASMGKGEGINVLPMLEHSIQLDSLNYFSLNLKGLILGESKDNQNEERAKKIFIRIITKEPQFESAYVNLGNIYWNAGDIDSAWDVWSLGHERFPQNSILARWTSIAEDSLKKSFFHEEP